MSRAVVFFFISVSLCLFRLQLVAETAALHKNTEWELKASMKYDALCLLNVLSGDAYYMEYYRSEYEHFHPLFTAEENRAFEQLKHVIKDEGGGIISAKLALYYSAVNDESLSEMIHTAQHSEVMRTELKKTSYWDDDGWKNYEKARPSLVTALRALDRVGFPSYWKEHAEPGIKQRIAQLTPDLKKYNIIPAIESCLGFVLPSETITVYLLAYSEPHGIRVTGLRFLTHESYPFTIVLHNAIHEPMHPPYHAEVPRIRKAVEVLAADPLVADKVKNHDPSFGYNTASGYIEEDSVEALEQFVSEQFGAGRDAREYWKDHDGGMHILAAAIYSEYKSAREHHPQTYSDWFVRAVETGELRGDKLRSTIDHFFSEGSGEERHK